YFLFAGFVLGQLALVVILLLAHRHQGDDASSGTLLAAALTILIGAAVGVIGIPGLEQGGLPRMVGTPIIAAGAALVGYAMVHHLAFVQARTVVRDFRLALLDVTARLITFVGGFLIIFAMLPYTLEPVVIATLACLLVLTSAPVGLQDRWPARLILPTWAVDYRAQISRLRDEPLLTATPVAALATAAPQVTQAVQAAVSAQRRETLQQAVDELFRYNRFHDDGFLLQSPLPPLLYPNTKVATSPTPADVTHLRARLVNTIDEELVRLTLPATDALDEDVLGLLILRKKYVEQRSRQEVERYLLEAHGVAVRGGAYSRALSAGRRHLAGALLAADGQAG
ncbi:MAG: hypothetical protein KDE20_16930, partial [Caldilineaceae bacterium]|nr:hypothetical protein [Caldilineaceae bacterium]